MLKRGTHFVINDEPCFGLSEINQMAPDNSAWHRYQLIEVVRDDRIATYRKDMGLAKDFTADQFTIPGGAIDKGKIYIEHTVGELKDIAFQLRERPSFDKKELARMHIKEDYGRGQR